MTRTDDLRGRARDRGASLVEYVIVVGLVALLAVAGFRAFGGTLSGKAEEQARCIEDFTTCPDGQPRAGSPDFGIERTRQPALQQLVTLQRSRPPTPSPAVESTDDDGGDDNTWSNSWDGRQRPSGPSADEEMVGAAEAETKPLPADKQVSDPTLRAIDAKLSGLFTDTGFVRAASSVRNQSVTADGKPTDSHYTFKDGKLHTLHIFANEAADSDAANVYIPKAFSDVMITSKDTVVARNPKTGEVILIAHVQVGSGPQGLKTLRENMKTVRPNGTVLIGKIGGEGGVGADGSYTHSHLSFFPNEAARLRATAYKKKNWEYTSETSENLADFRDLIE